MPGRTALETFLAADDDIPSFAILVPTSPRYCAMRRSLSSGYVELFKSGFVYRSPPPAPACAVKSAPQRNGRHLWRSVEAFTVITASYEATQSVLHGDPATRYFLLTDRRVEATPEG